MRVVRNKVTGRLIYREEPDFEWGKGITNAILTGEGIENELEEIEVTEQEWEAELALRREENLPKSMHVAALKSVSVVDGSPRGIVVRKSLGQNYEITNCRVSQTAYDNYQAGKIKVYDTNYGINAPENKDSFVLVYFISENPYDEEIEIPVIVDKVIK